MVQSKKGKSGIATSYMSRKQAMKKLQLSLKDFRRLCILKGIYPAEPRHKKKANKNNSKNKTYFYVKDIQFLMHEPVIDKFRAFKIFVRRLKRAVGKKDQESTKRIRESEPSYRLDHIVRERYPAFTDALRDLDDALSMCFLFSTIPKFRSVKVEMVHLCKRLTVEFMHYVMETRSLRKVFISIKGIYYQAEIMGQDITWIVPHALGFDRPTDVDFKIMVTFTEFYSTVLGFVNFKLYHTLNMMYPPKLAVDVPEEVSGEDSHDEFVAALNFSLKRMSEETDDFEEDELPELDEERAKKQKSIETESEKLKELFKNCKIYLNREVPRESLVFVIRSCGGQVSYDKTVSAGATFSESDDMITHHVVDRPNVTNKYLNRYYVQPQWIYDCVNSRKLLPVQPYFLGEVLPPHLSPFVKDDEYSYHPVQPFDSKTGAQRYKDLQNDEVADDSSSGNEEDNVALENEGISQKKQKRKKPASESSDPVKKMRVTPGVAKMKNSKEEEEKQLAEEKRLAIMMMPKKKKYLYDKIVYGQKRKKREVKKLKEKAEVYQHGRKQYKI